MRKILAFIFCVYLSINIKAQTCVFPIEIEYDMYLNFGNIEYFKSSLAFNGSYAYFNYQKAFDEENFRTDNIDNEYSVCITDTSINTIFTNRLDDVISEIIYRSDKEKYLIKETIDVIKWNVLDTKKQIDNYLCYQATCNFRGRNYTAWFTTDIPTTFGPLKLHGLPGLILELTDDTGEVALTAKTIRQKEIEMFWEESNCIQLTRFEYNNRIKQRSVDLMKRMASKADRGIKVSISTPKLQGIEIDE